MAEEERRRYSEEIYKNFEYEMEYNLNIARPLPLDDPQQYQTQFRVTYFISVQNDLGNIPVELGVEIRELYTILEEANRYIERQARLGKDAFTYDRSPKWNDFVKVVTKLRPSLEKTYSSVLEHHKKLREMIENEHEEGRGVNAMA